MSIQFTCRGRGALATVVARVLERMARDGGASAGQVRRLGEGVRSAVASALAGKRTPAVRGAVASGLVVKVDADEATGDLRVRAEARGREGSCEP